MWSSPCYGGYNMFMSMVGTTTTSDHVACIPILMSNDDLEAVIPFNFEVEFKRAQDGAV